MSHEYREELERLLASTRAAPSWEIGEKPTGLKGRAKQWLKEAAFEAGLVPRMGWHGERCAAVLMYHKVERRPRGPWGTPTLDVCAFREHLAYLTRNYEILSLSELIQHLRRGSLPKRAVSLTFDDGFRNNLLLAYPALRHFHVPATIFVAAGLVGTRACLWTHELQEMALRYGVTSVLGQAKDPVLAALAEADLPEAGRMDAAIRWLSARGSDACDAQMAQWRRRFPTEPDDEHAFMSWEDVRALHAGGLDIGSHSIRHPKMTELSDSELHDELRGSQELIAERLGVTPRLFCYPFGHFDDRVKAATARYYDAAVSVWPGLTRPGADLFELRRVGAFSAAELAVELARPPVSAGAPEAAATPSPVRGTGSASRPRSTPGRGVHVTVEAGPGALRRLGPTWEALLLDQPPRAVFRSHAVAMSWWNHLGRGDPRLIVAREDGEVKAILPFVELERSAPLSHRCWHLFAAQAGFADYLGIVAAPTDARRLAPALAEALIRYAEPERIELDDLDPDDPLLPALRQALPSGRRCVEAEAARCPFGRLEGDFEAYLQRRPRGLAAQHARRLHWLSSRPGYRYDRVGGDRIHEALDELVALHRARWGAESLSFEGAALGMHHELVERLVRQGAVELRLIHADGAPRAAVYALRWGGALYYLQAGYDPAWRSRRPGVVLIGLLLEECFRERVGELDFLRGVEPYKFDWVDAVRTTRTLSFSGPGSWPRVLMDLGERARQATTVARIVRTHFGGARTG